ncbi:MAG: DUF938 domain-containing protein [Pseudomonadota bacterium]
MEADFHPSVVRNHRPLGMVLTRFLDVSSTVFEIGAGDGGHIALLHRILPFASWQTSELAERLPALSRRIASLGDSRLPEPYEFAAGTGQTDVGEFDLVLTVNTFHIMTDDAVAALIAAVPALLKPGARFVVYGPFAIAAEQISVGNAEFDRALRRGGAGQGIRDLDLVASRAAAAGLSLDWRIVMPANNLVLVFGSV